MSIRSQKSIGLGLEIVYLCKVTPTFTLKSLPMPNDAITEMPPTFNGIDLGVNKDLLTGAN